MPGLVPGIQGHPLDCRVKPGNDTTVWSIGIAA
jgi:hypothetical protein